MTLIMQTLAVLGLLGGGVVEARVVTGAGSAASVGSAAGKNQLKFSSWVSSPRADTSAVMIDAGLLPRRVIDGEPQDASTTLKKDVSSTDDNDWIDTIMLFCH